MDKQNSKEVKRLSAVVAQNEDEKQSMEFTLATDEMVKNPSKFDLNSRPRANTNFNEINNRKSN